MKRPIQDFGPWASNLNSPTRLFSSSFWRRRMHTIARLRHTSTRVNRQVVVACGLVMLAIVGVPLVQFAPAATEEKVEVKPVPTMVEATNGAQPLREPHLSSNGDRYEQITDLDAIAAKLTHVRDIARRQEKLFENVKVRGRFLPADKSFYLVNRDGNCRFDLEFTQPNGNRDTSYWLDDGETLYSFGGVLVMSQSLGNDAKLFNHIATHFWLFHLPKLDGSRLKVSEFCGALVDHIREGTVFGKDSLWTLRLIDSGDVLSVEIEGRFQEPPKIPEPVLIKRIKVELDATRNYCMTRYLEWEVSPFGSDVFHYEEDIRTKYQEVAPSAFYLSEGTWRQSFSGSNVKEREAAKVSNTSLVVDSVEFGDFVVDKELFDVHHWPPIRTGMKVYDQRTEQHEIFIYEEGPFDESVLNRNR